MPRRMQAHTTAPRGKKCLVVMKDGSRFVDKFREKDKGRMRFDDHEIKVADLQMLTIYREMPGRG